MVMSLAFVEDGLDPLLLALSEVDWELDVEADVEVAPLAGLAVVLDGELVALLLGHAFALDLLDRLGSTIP